MSWAAPYRRPSRPPVSGNASADCLGIIADAAEFALWLSPRITTSIDQILAQLFKWAQPQIDAYLRAIALGAPPAARQASPQSSQVNMAYTPTRTGQRAAVATGLSGGSGRPMPLATLPVDRLGRLESTDGLPGRAIAADRAVSWKTSQMRRHALLDARGHGTI